MIQTAHVLTLGAAKVYEPRYGDLRLNVFPFRHHPFEIALPKLPKEFEPWVDLIAGIMDLVPYQAKADRHYATIDSKFFPVEESLRRPGIHIDGNFCVDPNFSNATWGGTTSTWSGLLPAGPEYIEQPDNSHVKMAFASPYDIVIPIGQYVSENKGGIITVATQTGCQAWCGDYYGPVGDGGDLTPVASQFRDKNKIVLEKDTLYFMTSNTPHESLVTKKGLRRTLIRITLDHRYENIAIRKRYESMALQPQHG